MSTLSPPVLSAIVIALLSLSACGGGGTTGPVVNPEPDPTIRTTQPPAPAWVNPERVTLRTTDSGVAVTPVWVGVVDADFDQQHAEIKNQIQAYQQFGTTASAGDTRHGTSVAQIIAGQQVGNSGNARLLLASAADNRGVILTSAVGLGGTWAFQQGARVVNISLGEMWELDGTNFTKPIYDAAVTAGGTLVMAAGNESASISTLLSGATIFDAGNERYRDLSLVAGALSTDGSSLAGYSNYPGADAGVQSRFLLAPGTNAVQPNGTATNTPPSGLASFMGTSSSTPVVAAAAATLFAYWPHLDGTQVSSLLLNSADKSFSSQYQLNTCGPSQNINCGSFYFGQGKLDLQKALEPVGTVTIQSGTRVSAQSDAVQSTSIVLPAAFGDAVQSQQITSAVFDSYGRNFSFNLAQRFGQPHTRLNVFGNDAAALRRDPANPAIAALQPGGAMGPPALSYASGRAGLRFNVGTPRHFSQANFGLGLARNGSENTSANASGLGAAMGARWAASERFSLHIGSAFTGSHNGVRSEAAIEFRPGAATSVTVGQALSFEKALLGTTGRGALAVNGSNGSVSFVRLRRDLGQGWSVFGHAEAGTLQVSGNRTLVGIRDVKTSQYGVGVAFQGQAQSLGLALSQPLRADRAQAHFRLATGRTAGGDVTYRTSAIDLRPSGRQLDLDLSYKLSLNRTSSLGALATYSRDAGHVARAKELGVAVIYQRAF